MAIVTPDQYYSDEDSYGNYQYATLKDIIDSMLLEGGEDDSYLKNVRRSTLIRHAKEAIREVTRQASNDVAAFEITVPDTLAWPFPQDYVNYVRISVVTTDLSTGSLRLQPLDVNYGINVADGYLQDHNAELLFDDQGYILMADSSNGYARPYKSYGFSGCYDPTLNTSRLSRFGEFKPDTKRGQFLFGSGMMNKEIVIEYISDGLHAGLSEDEITVHKYLRPTVENWIYYSCIERKRNIPNNEKIRALNRYKTTLHQAKVAMADFSLLRIARSLMGGSAMR